MTDKTTQQIATKIKQVRLKQSMTQVDVAKRADISPNYFARVERGEVKPSVEILQKITKALKVKSSEVLPF